MTSFDKQFPSLKGKGFRLNTREEAFMEPSENGAWITTPTIMGNCLDKQKVKEAIDRLREYDAESDQDVVSADEFIKELGL